MVPKICSVDGCNRGVRNAEGICHMHLRRLKRNGTTGLIPMDAMSRFLRNTHKTPGCWLWTGYVNPDGRGYLRVDYKRWYAYRLGYVLLVGPIPEGLTLDHLCSNPTCVNPDHLEPVTQGENSLRGTGPAANNKRKTHCIRGHEFAGDNLYVKPDGRRRCRTCAADAERNRRTAKLS